MIRYPASVPCGVVAATSLDAGSRQRVQIGPPVVAGRPVQVQFRPDQPGFPPRTRHALSIVAAMPQELIKPTGVPYRTMRRTWEPKTAAGPWPYLPVMA